MDFAAPRNEKGESGRAKSSSSCESSSQRHLGFGPRPTEIEETATRFGIGRSEDRTPALMFRTKRVYEAPTRDDGERILVDRLWPRGVRRDAARLADWRKDLAPSEGLRTWYSHDPAKFPRFRERYRTELFRHRDALADLVIRGERGPVTLVYAAKDTARCNAAVLRELLEELSAGSRAAPSRRAPRRYPPAPRASPRRREPAARDRPYEEIRSGPISA
jgi:uncharacterized protein YeaO (DUF488 family)